MRGYGIYLLFDPVGNNDTEDVQREFDGDKLAPGLMLSRLRCPNWNDGVEHSCSPSVDKTGADHPNVVLSRSLKSSADDSPSSSQSDGLDPTITVTEPATYETAHEGTEIVNGNNATLEKGVVDDGSTSFRVRVTKLHGCLIVIHCTVDTTHHTLIVSEKEDGKTSDTIDGDEKASLLQLVDHIGPRDDIHDGDYPRCLVRIRCMDGLSNS